MTNMKLSKRLQMICDLVDLGSDVIDVGCDHGLVGIYLATEKNCKVVCSDINEKALANAKKNIQENHLEDKIKTVITDGLEQMDTFDKTILICGMGTHTMMHIINHISCYDMKEFILQANTDLELLREYMVNQGFYISDERYLCERGKHYVFMKFKPGNLPYEKDDFLIGPVLKNSSRDYLEYLYQKRKELLQQIPRKHMKIRKKLRQEKRKIKKYLKNVEK